MERAAYLAGRWYPADERGCRQAIEAHAADTEPSSGPWTGLIAPHAGWYFSGDAAAHAFRWVAEASPDPDVVVLFGSHRGPNGPNTLFRGEGWQTPLGLLQTDAALVAQVAKRLSLADEPVRPAHPDNAAELQMPFVKHFFPRARLVMLGVEASKGALDIGRAVGEVVKESGASAVIVGSTDLTHYGPNYRFSPRGEGPEAVAWVRDENDRGFLDRVLADDPVGAVAHARAHQSACCPGAVAATIEATRVLRGSVAPRLVDHYLSHDVRPAPSFVGYGSAVL